MSYPRTIDYDLPSEAREAILGAVKENKPLLETC